MAIRIITDSASEFAQGEDPRVTVLPISIAFGTDTYLDGVDLPRERFYELLVEGEGIPTTGQVTPPSFSAALDDAAAVGDEALVITVSSELSGTYASALTAAEGRDGVVVLDSRTVSIGERIVVRRAIQLVEGGEDLSAVASVLESETADVRVVALLDTLEYLRRGGRIPASAARLGEFLAIKPVISVEDGILKLQGKARGSKNGRSLLRQEVERTGVDYDRPIELGYTGLSDSLLLKYLRDNRDLWEGHVTEAGLPVTLVGATVGTHTGPGTIGVAYFSKDGVAAGV